MPQITNDTWDTFKSPRGGWSAKLLACFGVNWPPRCGWKKGLIGKEISEENFQKAIQITRQSFLKFAAKAQKRVTLAKPNCQTFCLCGNRKSWRRDRCRKCIREESEEDPCWNNQQPS